MKQRIFHLQALSAVHVGTGQGEGAIDLPVMRTRATRLPIIPGSALKGVLRSDFLLAGDVARSTIFGPDVSDAARDDSAHAGAIAVGDAHLLVLPVRALVGFCAYVTSPYVLRRYFRDLGLSIKIPDLANGRAAVCPQSDLVRGVQDKIFLEELDYLVADDVTRSSAKVIADHISGTLFDGADGSEDWKRDFVSRFAILPDDAFGFLCDTATEVRARVRIDGGTRTVKPGQLWFEENLPMETVLWGVMGISRARDSSKLSEDAISEAIPAGRTLIQIGGKHTVGRGLCQLTLSEGAVNASEIN